MKRISQGILIVCCAAFFITCKQVEPQSDTGADYFPVAIGQTKVFSVDSITYAPFTGKKDSVRTYLKETITEETSDSNGFKIFRTERYISSDTSKGWSYTGDFFYYSNQYLINIVDGNITTTAFVIPVTKNRKWNINLYNQKEQVFASYNSVNSPFGIYPDCTEALINEDINDIEESVNKSIFARNKGLVCKIFSDIKFENSKRNGQYTITKLLER